jgi:hypothetical protein
VHELDHGCLVGGLTQLDHLGGDALVGLLPDLLHLVAERGEPGDEGLDVLGRGHRPAHLVVGGHRYVVESEQVGRVGGGHQQGAVAQEGDRDRPVAAGPSGVDQRGGALIDLEDVQVHVVEAVALGERLGQLGRVDDAGVDQRAAQGESLAAAGFDRALHEPALREAQLDDHVADPALGPCPLRRWDQPGQADRTC